MNNTFQTKRIYGVSRTQYLKYTHTKIHYQKYRNTRAEEEDSTNFQQKVSKKKKKRNQNKLLNNTEVRRKQKNTIKFLRENYVQP